MMMGMSLSAFDDVWRAVLPPRIFRSRSTSDLPVHHAAVQQGQNRVQQIDAVPNADQMAHLAAAD